MRFDSINPTTGRVLETFDPTPPARVAEILAAAAGAFAAWQEASADERTARLRDAAHVLRARTVEFARTIAFEMGKPVVQGEAEIEKCAAACEFYATHGAAMLAPEPAESDAGRAYVRFDPLGAVLAVMPWNFPFWQVFRCAAPILTAGNAFVLKHAANVPRCAREIAGVFRAADFPAGLFGHLLIDAGSVGGVIADPRIAAVTLTGSERAGSAVAAAAGQALKKAVLELGGSDPFLVLADADLDRAAAVAADARLFNSGQSCINAKRFIVVDAVADGFVERLGAEMAARRVGDPLDRATQVGPLARVDLRDALHRQVEGSVARGARCVLGGRVPDGPGAFYPPTLLVDVAPGMPAFDEETFGPVAAVIRARDEAHAVRLANASPLGLGASIWTTDRARAEGLAPAIEAGAVFVNAQVRSEMSLPFGGVKRSGYGRELGVWGLREFTNVKTVVVA